MAHDLVRRLGIELPLLAFSHCRDVVAEVSRNGGLGVLGAALLTPEELENELSWIDAHCGGKPYGIDLIIPRNVGAQGGGPPPAMDEAKAFVDHILQRYQIDPGSADSTIGVTTEESLSPAIGVQLLNVALSHNVRLFANALGEPPQEILDLCHEKGVLVAALAGSAKHARRQVAAGVDVIIASGYEAGGHTGDIGTMVLVPEIIRAIEDKVPVLAAGGIVTGRQIVAAIALGAAAVWTGSVWLTTPEAETAGFIKESMVAASSSDTIRSKFRTGKPSRQLRSAWHDEWAKPGAPAPLPMPYMGQVCEPPLRRAEVLADAGQEGARKLSTYWVGQGVGLMSDMRPVRAVIMEMLEDCAEAIERVSNFGGE